MLHSLDELDRQLFLFLNGFHTEWLDELMYWITNKYTWFPLYLLLIVLLIKKYRIRGLVMCLGMVLAVGISDQITSGWMKPFFGRLRPCQVPDIQSVVHLVAGCGGKYGFASSHASTTFALATVVWLMLRSWSASFGWVFAWSAIVAYSRVYVGVHYPLDILVGAMIGFIVGWLVYGLYQWVVPKLFKAANSTTGLPSDSP